MNIAYLRVSSVTQNLTRQEEDMKNKEDLLSKLNMLNGKVTVIRAGIDQLEKLIQDEKNNSERVMKEMKELLIHLK